MLDVDWPESGLPDIGHVSFIMPGDAAVAQGHGFSHVHGAHLHTFADEVLLHPTPKANEPTKRDIIIVRFMGTSSKITIPIPLDPDHIISNLMNRPRRISDGGGQSHENDD